ncbi:MAG: nicotinate-nucleotide adenylyltransferase [Lysobacteraceae bacterium]
MSASTAPLAIYGGAFDPIHLGHLALARAVRDVFDVQVHLLPTGDPRHRDPARTTAQHRLAMLEAATEHEPRIAIDTREIERDGPSYTVDTLTELRAERGLECPLLLTLGADAFAGLAIWHRWRELIGLAHFIIALRPGFALGDVKPELAQLLAQRRSEHPAELRHAPAGRIFELPMLPHPQSSSEIRRRIAAGLSLEGWVAPAVERHIRTHGLYGSGI